MKSSTASTRFRIGASGSHQGAVKYLRLPDSRAAACVQSPPSDDGPKSKKPQPVSDNLMNLKSSASEAEQRFQSP